MNTCAGCKFWVRTDDKNIDLNHRTCIRYPPVIVVTPAGLIGAQPITGHKTRCGEFQVLPPVLSAN